MPALSFPDFQRDARAALASRDAAPPRADAPDAVSAFEDLLPATPAEPAAPGRTVENHGRIRSAEARAEAGLKASGKAEASAPDAPAETAPPAVPAKDGAAADRGKAYGQAVAAAAREKHEPEPAPASAEPPVPAAGPPLPDLQTAVSEPAVASDASAAVAEAAEQDEATDVSLADGSPPDTPLPDAAPSGETAQAAPPPDAPAAPVSASTAAPVPPAPTQPDTGAVPPREVGSPQRRRGPAEAAFAAPRATPSAHSAAANGPPGLMKHAPPPDAAATGDVPADPTATADVPVDPAASDASAAATPTSAPNPPGPAAAPVAQAAPAPDLAAASIGLPVAQSSISAPSEPRPTPAPVAGPTAAPSTTGAEAVSHSDERRKAAPAEPAAPGGQTFNARVFELPPATHGAPRVEAADAAQPGPAAPAPAPAQPATPVAMVPIEIGMRALEGARQFQIRLHPEEYGRVDVKLDLDGDGRVKAHLVVDRVETLALLQRDARTLERAFEQAGLKTGDGALQFSLGQQGQQGQQGHSHHPDAARRAFARPDLRAEPSPEARLHAALRGVRVGASGLDISI